MIRSYTKGLVTAVIALASAGATFAQFTLEGQYRPRLELRNGFKTPINENTNPAAFVEHRAKLTAGYSEEKLGFKMSVQDIRIWGETGQINKSDYLLSTHEAYGEYKPSTKSTFRIGRQEMAYDGHRLIGTLGWAAQARSFDAVKYMYADTSGNALDVMVSWNQTGLGESAPEPAKLTGTYYATANGGGTTRIFNLGLPKSQQMLYYKKKLSSGTVGIMLLNDIFDAGNDTTHYSQFTAGVTPDFKFGDFKVGGQFYYTGGAAGKTLDTIDNKYNTTKLGGFMFNLTVQHTGLSFKPLIGVDYLSGDDKSTADKVEGWSPSYGTNHKFYGFMDYFYVGNGHGGGNAASAGLMDIYLKTTFKTGEKSKLLAHVHYFASTAERTGDYDADGNTEAYKGGLGTEIDLVYVQPLAPGVVLKAGYSQMFGTTDTMGVLKGYDKNTKKQGLQSWAWVMMDFTPKFLK